LTQTPEVEHLIEKTRRGDREAFHSLYQLYARKILNFCYRLMASREAAEEVTQETFISVFQNIAKLKDPTRFEPWLFMIARNYVYQAFRKKKKLLVSINETDEDKREIIRPESKEDNPEEDYLKKELRETVLEIIQSMNLKYREVFILAVLEGYSYKEVAEMVGRKVQSVKTDIHRARLKIREALSHYLEKGTLQNEL